MKTRRYVAHAVIAVVTAALALAGLVGTATAQEGSGPAVEAARQVTTDPNPARLHVIPDVAVHPDDPNTVVVGVPEYRHGGCPLFVSQDGGLSFTQTADLLPAEFDFCARRPFGRAVDVEFASDGTLYVGLGGSAVATGHPNGPTSALFARSTDLGQTFEATVVMSPRTVEAEGPEGRTDEVREQHDMASVAVDPNDPDRVYMGWRRQTEEPSFSERKGFPTGVASIDPLWSMVATSTDGGRSWSDPVNLTTEADGELPDGSDVPELVVDQEGVVYAFTRERASGDDAVNGLFMFRSTDGGETWTSTRIDEGANRITTPDAAIDPDTGNLYVAYELQGESRDLPTKISFLSSTDGGDTWSDPVVITDEDVIDKYNQYFPGISVAPDGRIDVAWWDFRNDPFFAFDEPQAHDAGERFGDIYYTFSTDGGQTWSPDQRLTDRSFDVSHGVAFPGATRGPVGIAATDDATLVVWPDTRAATPVNAVEDAYLTRVRHDPSMLSAAASSDVSAMGIILGAGGALALAGLVLFALSRRRIEPPPLDREPGGDPDPTPDHAEPGRDPVPTSARTR